MTDRRAGQCSRASRRVAGLAPLIGASAAVLAGCGPHPLTYSERYAGRLSGCEDVPASLVRTGDSFSFAPGDGVLVIRGTVSPDGGIDAVLNTQPAGKPAFVLRVSGRLERTRAVLDYTTPRCAAHAVLSAVE